MATPSTLSENIDSLFALTLRNWRDRLADNIFRGNALTAHLIDNDHIREDSNGGNRVSMPIMYGKNSTVGSYEGYDTIDTTAQDNISTAYYKWRQIAGSVAISGREQRQNKGRSAIMNLLEKKTKNLQMTMRDELNNQILNSFSAGNNGKDLEPIPKIVSDDPTSATDNPVGAIDGSKSANSFWRNQNTSSSASNKTELKEELYHLYNLASKGQGGRPDLHVTDMETYEMYMMALDENQRYVDEDTADLGFDNLRLRGGVIIWDEITPDAQNRSTYDGSSISKGTVYALNLDFLEIVVDPDAFFEPTQFVKPSNQDAKVAQVLFQGIVGTSNRRKHGVLYNIDRNL